MIKVDDVMRLGDELRTASERRTVREVFTAVRRKGRRTGAVMLTDDAGRLAGFFTDSDLARLFEQRRDDALDRPIAQVMIPTPITVPVGTKVVDAVEIMRRCKISELPVIDLAGRPVGLLDVTDLIGWLPVEEQAAA
jgi:arabinose-5-phosphate isomerase